jgi:hypothetical protein
MERVQKVKAQRPEGNEVSVRIQDRIIIRMLLPFIWAPAVAVHLGVAAEENNGVEAQESVRWDSFRRRIKKYSKLNGPSPGV